jgi:hypothetical protein
MLSLDDLTQMQADLAAVRGDNQVSVVIRRGTTTLAAQQVRVARLGPGQKREDVDVREARGQVVLLGSTSFDVQLDDRFTLSGVLYRVSFVRPNRTVAVMAEAEQVE